MGSGHFGISPGRVCVRVECAPVQLNSTPGTGGRQAECTAAVAGTGRTVGTPVALEDS